MHWKKCLFALAVIPILSLAALADPGSDLKAGQELMKDAKYDDAIVLFSAVVRSGDPALAPKGQLCIGIALQGKKLYPESISALKLGIQKYPDAERVRKEMLYRLGEVYGITGDSASAIAIYQSIAVQYPADAANADFRLARTYFGLKRYAEAIDLLKKSIAAHPDAGNTLSELNSLLGQCYRESGDYETAVAIYRALIAQFPASADKAYLAMGICLQFQGKYTEAREAFQTALEMGNGASNEARLRIDEVLRAEKDYAGELAWLQKMYDEVPELRADSLTRQAEVLSECLGGTSNASGAIGKLRQLIREFPDEPPAVEAQARIAAIQVHNLRDYAVAEPALRDFMTKYPDYPALMVVAHDLAYCSYDQKNYAAAATRFIDATKQKEVGNYAALCLYLAADCYMRTGDFQKAKAQADLLISKYPDESWAVLAKTDYAQLTGEGKPGGVK
ncbi:MAG TPA: tetratricopeptide repeat protein [Armatimonadota bacterium]|jgi:TolA-binding protein